MQFDRSRLMLPTFDYGGIARLKPGVTTPEANADVARMLPIWLRSWPPFPGGDPRFYTDIWKIGLRPELFGLGRRASLRLCDRCPRNDRRGRDGSLAHDHGGAGPQNAGVPSGGLITSTPHRGPVERRKLGPAVKAAACRPGGARCAAGDRYLRY